MRIARKVKSLDLRDFRCGLEPVLDAARLLLGRGAFAGRQSFIMHIRPLAL
jgi:hypothetical protein